MNRCCACKQEKEDLGLIEYSLPAALTSDAEKHNLAEYYCFPCARILFNAPV